MSGFRRAWKKPGWRPRGGPPCMPVSGTTSRFQFWWWTTTESRRYNRIYRQQDAPTDVLSFAVHEGPALAAEVPDALAAELDSDLGDLVLAFPYASRQAIQHGHTLAAEMQLLVVHGTLHLLGYDHDTETRHADMWRKQSAILSSLTDEDLTPRLTAPDW